MVKYNYRQRKETIKRIMNFLLYKVIFKLYKIDVIIWVSFTLVLLDTNKSKYVFPLTSKTNNLLVCDHQEAKIAAVIALRISAQSELHLVHHFPQIVHLLQKLRDERLVLSDSHPDHHFRLHSVSV